MKQRIMTCFVILILIAGLSLLLYPSISNYINKVRHRRAVFDYTSEVETLSDEQYRQILEAAMAYNTALAENPVSFMGMSDQQRLDYESQLDITGTGIMGYITIEKADISLPIYHGTSEAVLQVGVGHIEGSSLPVGGESAHCLLSGHRGLPSAMLFTNIDKLDRGDTFALHVLEETFVYEVDDIRVVEPQDVSALGIYPGKDYCTLITCTPYGINSHRLLVRGVRRPLSPIDERMELQSGAKRVNILFVIAAVEVPVLVITLIVMSVSRRRRLSKTTNSEVSE